MKAVQVVGHGRDPGMTGVPTPSVTGPYDVVGRIGGAVVCRADLHILVCAVIGAGGLGHIGVQVLKALTAAEIVVVDRNPDAVEPAGSTGADDRVSRPNRRTPHPRAPGSPPGRTRAEPGRPGAGPAVPGRRLLSVRRPDHGRTAVRGDGHVLPVAAGDEPVGKPPLGERLDRRQTPPRCAGVSGRAQRLNVRRGTALRARAWA
ncbi:hypothetical protein [Streptomyces sp. NPDC047000]|uniref:hypothetical protein n=1 Tax=Streptomyces sp. NPDC047000 TaxID=3155474 RepID=UPI0033C327E0